MTTSSTVSFTTAAPARPTPAVSARLAGLEPVVHGGLSGEQLRRLGLDPELVVDLSSNVSPYGPPPALTETLRAVSIDRYPHPTALAMREAIAAHLGVTAAQVVAGNGSVELIYLIAQVYLDPGDRALIIGPTFGEYAAAIAFAGAWPIEYRARADEGFRIDLDAVLDLIAREQPKLVFCCNPNNPTGQTLAEPAVRAVLDATARCGGLLVLDEAYRSLADEDARAWETLDLLAAGPVALLRSLTKDYAVPGLRLGYALTPPAVGQALNALRIPWSINVFAEAVGRRLLAETAYLAASRARLQADKAYLVATLDAIGARRVPSVANYLLIEVGSAPDAATRCRQALLPYGVVVRDCTSFGLPRHIRVCVHLPAATDQLATGLRAWQTVAC